VRADRLARWLDNAKKRKKRGRKDKVGGSKDGYEEKRLIEVKE
jgi:hypothetical protein